MQYIHKQCWSWLIMDCHACGRLSCLENLPAQHSTEFQMKRVINVGLLSDLRLKWTCSNYKQSESLQSFLFFSFFYLKGWCLYNDLYITFALNESHAKSCVMNLKCQLSFFLCSVGIVQKLKIRFTVANQCKVNTNSVSVARWEQTYLE